MQFKWIIFVDENSCVCAFCVQKQESLDLFKFDNEIVTCSAPNFYNIRQ